MIKRCQGKLTAQPAVLLAGGLLLIGVVLRLLYLDKLPYGLNQDEASAGYDAWALLNSGIDRNGKSWPVLFVSWGSGQNVLMSYLAMPFIALMGLSPLSVRLPNALAGCVTLFVFWRLARRCRGESFGLLALFLLVINPWHIMASRWGLESNLLPALLCGACFFLSQVEETPKALLGVAVCLGLAPYAYGTVFFLLPPFLIWIVIRLRRSLKQEIVWASLLVFLVLIFPIALCQALNVLGREELKILGITFPRLIDVRQNSTSVLGGGGLGEIWKNFQIFLRILHNGDDGVEYNALPFWKGGIFYFFGLPLAVLGVIVSLCVRRERNEEWPMLALLGCSVLCAALIEGNINRLNMAWIPMVYFCAVGGSWLTAQLRIRRALPLAVVLISFCYFGYSYISGFAPPGNEKYYPGLGETIIAAKERSLETLYITDQVREPYIYALFYTTPQPERYLNSVECIVEPEAGMWTVKRFEGFEFEDPGKTELMILYRNDALEQGQNILETYGSFALCQLQRQN